MHPTARRFWPTSAGLQRQQIAYGAYARERHVGGKVGISRTLSKIRSEWMSDNGLVSDTDRPMIEIYLDDPSRVPIAQQRIDVCLPVMFPADQTTFSSRPFVLPDPVANH